MKGRFHHYEGWSMNEVVFPLRVFKLLGVENLILTTPQGGINTQFKPGDLMLIRIISASLLTILCGSEHG